MTQVSKYPLRKDVYDYIADIFLHTFSSFSDSKRVESFISDFLTPTEKIMLTKRLAIFVMLAKGYTYIDIRRILRVSPSTVAGASRYYKYLGKGSKDVVANIIKNEKFQTFWITVGEAVSGTISSLNTRSKSWYNLHQEIRKQKIKKQLL